MREMMIKEKQIPEKNIRFYRLQVRPDGYHGTDQFVSC
jgi:hypothetical protein